MPLEIIWQTQNVVQMAIILALFAVSHTGDELLLRKICWVCIVCSPLSLSLSLCLSHFIHVQHFKQQLSPQKLCITLYKHICLNFPKRNILRSANATLRAAHEHTFHQSSWASELNILSFCKLTLLSYTHAATSYHSPVFTLGRILIPIKWIGI